MKSPASTGMATAGVALPLGRAQVADGGAPVLRGQAPPHARVELERQGPGGVRIVATTFAGPDGIYELPAPTQGLTADRKVSWWLHISGVERRLLDFAPSPPSQRQTIRKWWAAALYGPAHTPHGALREAMAGR